jgi:hypothetical protein
MALMNLQQQGIGAAELDRWIEGKKQTGWEVTQIESGCKRYLIADSVVNLRRTIRFARERGGMGGGMADGGRTSRVLRIQSRSTS